MSIISIQVLRYEMKGNEHLYAHTYGSNYRAPTYTLTYIVLKRIVMALSLLPPEIRCDIENHLTTKELYRLRCTCSTLAESYLTSTQLQLRRCGIYGCIEVYYGSVRHHKTYQSTTRYYNGQESVEHFHYYTHTYACDHSECYLYLLSGKLSTCNVNFAKTWLRRSIAFGYNNVVKYILENPHGVPKEELHSICFQFIGKAVRKGHVEVVRYLLEKYDPNLYKDFLIEDALKGKHLDMIRLLLPHCSNYITLSKYEILYSAILAYDVSLVEYMLSYDVPSQEWYDLALSQAAALDNDKIMVNDVPLMRYLQEHQSNVSIRNGSKVCDMISKRDFRSLELLLRRWRCSGALLHAINLAAGKGYLSILEMLLQHRVVIQRPRRYLNSALAQACRYGHPDIATYVINKGADVKSLRGMHIKYTQKFSHI